MQKRYIDTGKVRYIFREFPLDALAAAGFMLARCAGKDKFMPIIETLFAKQREWMVQKPIDAAQDDRQAIRLHPGDFRRSAWRIRRCSTASRTVRDRAAEKLGVNSTPTFFVNGKKLIGDQSIDAMAKEIDPYLKEG